MTMHLGSYLYQTPMSMEQKVLADGYSTKGLDGALNPYEGYVQSRMSCFNRGNIDEFFFTTELSRKYDYMTWRVGVNEWYYDVDYASNTTMYDHTVEEYTPNVVQRRYEGYSSLRKHSLL